jgi:hypothetical protein
LESTKASITTSATQQDRETEEVFQICARAGVSCISIQRGFGHAPDYVLFQPVVTTLAVPLAAFANPDEAIAAIKAKLAQSSFAGGADAATGRNFGDGNRSGDGRWHCADPLWLLAGGMGD